MRDHRGDRIVPAQQARARGIKNYEIGLCAWSDDAEIFTMQGEAAVAGGKKEGLVDGHWVLSRVRDSVRQQGWRSDRGGVEPGGEHA